MRKYSLREIMAMDQLLFQLATYETTCGLAFIPEDMDQLLEINKSIAKKFNFFKRMIQNSECTLDELQQLVIAKNGPIPNEYHNLTFDESLDKMSKKNLDEVPKERFDVRDILHNLMEDIVERNGYVSSDVIVKGPYFATPRSEWSSEKEISPKKQDEPKEIKKNDKKKRSKPKKTDEGKRDI